MDISYVCVLVAAFLPYILVGYAKFSKGYDNHHPREFLDKLEGTPKRAHYAQLNAFEAFPAFAAAVIIAHLTNVPLSITTILAVLFIIFRILYSICYIADKPTIRSVLWFGGFLCVLVLFILSILRTVAL